MTPSGTTREAAGSVVRTGSPPGRRPLPRAARRFLLTASALALAAAAALPARAAPRSRRPSRADFEAAVLDLAATEIPAHPCDHGDPEAEPETVPPRSLERSERVRVLGRIVPLGSDRFAAVLAHANGDSDANEDLAYDFEVVLLSRRAPDAPWTASVLPLGADVPPFMYDDRAVLILRKADVDDDGEPELHIVMSTNSEVQCGTGYCTVRWSFIVDLDGTGELAFARESQRDCDSDFEPQFFGTILFADRNADGHRDVVHRGRSCPGLDVDAAGDYAEAPCGPRTDTVFMWQAASDRYGPADGAAAAGSTRR